MPNDINPEEILSKAEKITKRSEVYPIHHFRAVYVLRYGLDEKEATKRAFLTQVCFIEEGLMDEFAFRLGRRYKFNDDFVNNQEEFSKEVYDFVIDYEKHFKKRRIQSLEKSILNGGKDLVDYIDDYLNEVPFPKKYQEKIKQTEYSRFVKNFSYEFYCNIVGFDVGSFLKSNVCAGGILVDFFGTRNLAVKFANRLKGSFKRQGYITDKEKIFNNKGEIYIRTELESYLENLLPDYLYDLRGDLGIDIGDSEDPLELDDSDED